MDQSVRPPLTFASPEIKALSTLRSSEQYRDITRPVDVGQALQVRFAADPPKPFGGAAGDGLLGLSQRVPPSNLQAEQALLGALLFAFFDALQLRLQQSGAAVLPYQVYLMLPYALSILALVLVARRAAYPQALMKPYRKGER